jgi:hypothetical protein
MLSVFMVSRRRFAALVLVPAALFLIETSCNRVPLLAPSGSTITLTTATSVLPVGGSATILAQVLENAGTPPQAGTHVTFTTSLGTIQPSDTTTDSSGRATATLTSTSSGTASITAISGGATTGTNPLKILVGTAAAQKVAVSATPATVPSAGGSSVISAIVFDINGAVLTNIPVTFSTTAGTLSSSITQTDATGTATSTLMTSVAATVTASVGVGTSSTTPTTGTPTTPGTTTPTTPSASGTASGSVTVSIAAAPTLVITPPATAPTAGIPTTFTFAVTVPTTNGSAVKSLVVDWGDGSPLQNLGSVTGNAVVSHTFGKDGTYVVTGTVTDASGNTVAVSSVVFVQVAPPLAVTLAVSESVSGTNTIASFTATVTGLGTAVAQSYHWTFGDGQTDDTSSNQTSHTYVTSQLPKTASVTVTTSTGVTSQPATKTVT